MITCLVCDLRTTHPSQLCSDGCWHRADALVRSLGEEQRRLRITAGDDGDIEQQLRKLQSRAGELVAAMGMRAHMPHRLPAD